MIIFNTRVKPPAKIYKCFKEQNIIQERMVQKEKKVWKAINITFNGTEANVDEISSLPIKGYQITKTFHDEINQNLMLFFWKKNLWY